MSNAVAEEHSAFGQGVLFGQGLAVGINVNGPSEQ